MSDSPGTHEPRQRWRLVVARDTAASMGTQRDATTAWIDALHAAGLPIASTEGEKARPRVSIGAPLPGGMTAEGELIDVVLDERWPAWRVRESLAPRVPEGWRLVDLVDVWLSGPPLAGRVAAADYRIELVGEVTVDALERAAEGLLAARSIPRERMKGGSSVAYDLRPLLIDVRIEPGQPTIVETRTRFHPELGTGRPEEVLAALAEAAGMPLETASTCRERLLLVDDLDRPGSRVD